MKGILKFMELEIKILMIFAYINFPEFPFPIAFWIPDRETSTCEQLQFTFSPSDWLLC